LFRFKPISTATLINAIPDFALCAGFLITWISPYAFGDRSISRFISLILLEFSALIAGVIVSPLIRTAVYFFGGNARANRTRPQDRESVRDRTRNRTLRTSQTAWSLRGVGAFMFEIFAVGYYVFIVLIAIVVILVLRNPGGINSSSLWWFGLLLLNRSFASTFSHDDPATEFARIAPIFGIQMVTYVVLLMSAITLPLPRLGITPGVMAVQWPSAAGHSGEIYNDQPWRFLAWGAAYYAAIAIGELVGTTGSFPE
jgi:hypothetical protein